jgi:hypothetical protein
VDAGSHASEESHYEQRMLSQPDPASLDLGLGLGLPDVLAPLAAAGGPGG